MESLKPNKANTKVRCDYEFFSFIFNEKFFLLIEKIRVGRDYQAICPPLIPDPERKPDLMADRALLVWSPTKEITDKSCK